MTIDEITQKFKEQMDKAPSIGKKLKFVFDEGAVLVDLTGEKPVITNEDSDADCTIKTKIETLNQLIRGEINPMMAMMTGKVKIQGDMSVAMKLKSLLS